MILRTPKFEDHCPRGQAPLEGLVAFLAAVGHEEFKGPEVRSPGYELGSGLR